MQRALRDSHPIRELGLLDIPSAAARAGLNYGAFMARLQHGLGPRVYRLSESRRARMVVREEDLDAWNAERLRREEKIAA